MKKYVWDRSILTNKFFHILGRVALYLILIAIGFVFLMPILTLLSSSLMDIYDLSNSMVTWIPTKFTMENYQRAFEVMGGMKTVFLTIGVMFVIALAQTLSSALIAYGFAKYDFWGKKIFFALMIATFILPTQVTALPKYVMFNNYGMRESILPFLLPSLLGQGIKNAIFILIFYQFFKMTPKSLDEAASIDGASQFKIFAVINLVMAGPAIVVDFIFSFVWNWNETYLADSYFGNAIVTLPLALERFKTTYEKMFPVSETASNPLLQMNEGIISAGTLISIIPLIIAYVLFERKLIESIDKSGITGE